MLEFGEDLFDRVEIGAVGRQEQQSCADAADRLAHFAAFMAAEIVHDNHVTGLEGRQQKLAHIGEESRAVDRAVQHARGVDPVTAQRRKKGLGPPSTVWRLADEACPTLAPSAQRRHIRLHPGFINENQPGRLNPALILAPLHPPPRDRRTVLFAGERGFL